MSIQSSMDFLLPSPIHKIRLPKQDTDIFLKRDDLIHPAVSGNKWRKLKYNILEIQASSMTSIVTFGGPFSNHLYACSELCNQLGIKLTCYVRTEKHDNLNPTLNFVRNNGAEIKLVSRDDYRRIKSESFANEVMKENPNAFVISEGGSNKFALQGVGEMVDEIIAQAESTPNYIFVPVGSGGTLAGIINSAPPTTQIIGICAVNDFGLEVRIKELLPLPTKHRSNWSLDFEFTMGGFAKYNSTLIDFINDFGNINQIKLDPVYTGKMMMGIQSYLEEKKISKKESIMAIHTGGLQGVEAFNYVNGPLLL